MANRNLFLWAKPTVKEKHLGTDDGVQGFYIFSVDNTLSNEDAASAVLDGFHETTAVDTLDNFEFLVFNADGFVIVPSDTPSYTMGGYVQDSGNVDMSAMKLVEISNTQWVCNSRKQAIKMFSKYFPNVKG